MIEQKKIETLVDDFLAQENRESFLVSVTLQLDNRIVVEIDNDQYVDVEECATLNRWLHEAFGEELDDYELEVGSAGLTAPLKTVRQYLKYLNKEVEILTKTGIKESGILKSADAEGCVVSVIRKEKPEGAKKKIEVMHDITFPYSEIKYTKYLIRFK